MSEQISDEAWYIAGLKRLTRGKILKVHGAAWVTFSCEDNDHEEISPEPTLDEAIVAQAEIDRETEVSDAEALDLFRSLKEVESANLGPDGCGLGMRATLWLKAKKARAR